MFKASIERDNNIAIIRNMSMTSLLEVSKSVGRIGLIVERRAKRRARSGGFFSSRSLGTLASTLRTVWSPGRMYVEIVVGVLYGMIQEFGGIINRVSTKGKSYTIEIPEVRYMRRSFEEEKKRIDRELKNLARKLLRTQ